MNIEEAKTMLNISGEYNKQKVGECYIRAKMKDYDNDDLCTQYYNAYDCLITDLDKKKEDKTVTKQVVENVPQAENEPKAQQVETPKKKGMKNKTWIYIVAFIVVLGLGMLMCWLNY